MLKFLSAAVAAIAIITPASARDSSPYVGIEGGIISAGDMGYDRIVRRVIVGTAGSTTSIGLTSGELGEIEFKRGYDVDLIAGYDFGMFRLEGELGYKRANAQELDFPPELVASAGNTPLTDEEADLSGGLRARSLMANALLDIGAGTGVGFYAGGGIGRARVALFKDKDSAWAWQLIAGVRAPLGDHLDIGLKYRYFRTGKLAYQGATQQGATFIPGDMDTGTTLSFDVNDRFRSHSLLASLTYNFGSPAAPPPPPPPPPAAFEPAAPPSLATQTCADGAVILATDTCPVPPPPPPPPSSGERG